MSSKNILLVDDSPFDIELTVRALERSNVANQIDIARDGSEALDYLYCQGIFSKRERVNPVLILLDLHMPKLGGIEVLRQVRADPELKRIPVVVFSSSREERDILESYELGVNAYLVKPVEFEKFGDAVKQLGLFWLLMNEPSPR
jgi:CheY-like chemotaxis protein